MRKAIYIAGKWEVQAATKYQELERNRFSSFLFCSTTFIRSVHHEKITRGPHYVLIDPEVTKDFRMWLFMSVNKSKNSE